MYKKSSIGYKKGEKNNKPDMSISKTKTKAWILMNFLESWEQKYFS